jgi:hypothetical protein
MNLLSLGSPSFFKQYLLNTNESITVSKQGPGRRHRESDSDILGRAPQCGREVHARACDALSYPGTRTSPSLSAWAVWQIYKRRRAFLRNRSESVAGREKMQDRLADRRLIAQILRQVGNAEYQIPRICTAIKMGVAERGLLTHHHI